MSTTTDKKTTESREIEARRFIEKIVLNAGVGKAAQTPGFEDKGLVQIMRDLELLAGQHPQVRPSKTSIAGFKMREGDIVGVRVTLRERKKVDFLERLIRIVLPRVHDFRGIDPGSIDAGGTLNMGFKEQFVFPEIDPEESPLIFSLGVNIVPRVKDREEALNVYKAMGLPLMEESQKPQKKKRKASSKK